MIQLILKILFTTLIILLINNSVMGIALTNPTSYQIEDKVIFTNNKSSQFKVNVQSDTTLNNNVENNYNNLKNEKIIYLNNINDGNSGNKPTIKSQPPVFSLPSSDGNGSTSNASGSDSVGVTASNLFLLSELNENVSTEVFSLNSEVSRRTMEERGRRRRIKRDKSNKSICEINDENGMDCKCTNENNFTTVACDFLQDKEFVLSLIGYIPEFVSSMIITVRASAARLIMDEAFFHSNRINRFLITGHQNSNAHLELSSNAFSQNYGIFPEIVISNLRTVYLHERAFKGEFQLNITNCLEVYISNDTFAQTEFNGYFENIKDLRLYERAFSKAKAKIAIINCNLEYLKIMIAPLIELQLLGSKIDRISEDALSFLEAESIILKNCTIGTIQSNATAKLYCKKLEISGCTIGKIETDAMTGGGADKLFFNYNNVTSIDEKAISLYTINTEIMNNTIYFLGENWFEGTEGWANITIINNNFGDFKKLTISDSKSAQHCLFRNNVITKANAGSLNLQNAHCDILDISFKHSCTCDIGWLKNLTNNGVDLKAESFCTVDETLKSCYNTELLNVAQFLVDFCDNTEKSVNCMTKNVPKKEIHFPNIDSSNVNEKNDATLMFVIYVASGCLLLFILCCVMYFCIVKIVRLIKKSNTITIPLSHMNVGTNLAIMKQSKSFSNDDRDIIARTLENMKRKYSPEKYDQVYNNTKKLLAGNLTESEKVLTIGEIVKTLDECENAGEDFVAFTDILYKHLAPKANNNNMQQTDPIYAEPNLANDDDERVLGGLDDQTNIDHIYAEPNSLQQPLLTNEYSSPVDINNEQGHLYSEPLPNPNDKTRHIISPYAIGNNIKSTPPSIPYDQQPSTSRNLPDVLNQSSKRQLPMIEPSNLSIKNSKLFHVTRSPNTNREIPKYTMPISKSHQHHHSPESLSSSEESTAHSDHSGGSDITCKIDDVIEYADA